ncbi:protamine-2 (modular protein) [Tianweitania sp. BSSL-BM11]|uniref:Protamine-2 (Modular protein) n=1 Tax=Tianweitania aestuarii TaxID=2814886 RepID=A0ABS5RQF2_9HYPH|nr:protamine-2 (modular protein) [Tianweitania aestuarii]MBS9719274.1 protamine-2 (modular protein) [Tianweitania aestuarii]
MDRRHFITGLFGLAGAVAVAKVVGPTEADAAVVKPEGILDELDASTPEVTEIDHRRGHRDRRRHGRHLHDRRHRRRRVTRRVCRRVRRHGRWERRCWRERVWINI